MTNYRKLSVLTDVSDKFRKTPKSVKADRAAKIDRILIRMSILCPFFGQFRQSAPPATLLLTGGEVKNHSSLFPHIHTVLSGYLFKNPSSSIFSRDLDPRVKGVCGGDYP